MVSSHGTHARRIADTSFAILDFETTGLSPGADRVLEISVVRLDPGQQPRLVFDTLVNPQRPVSPTEIHGITDADVADAPRFQDIAGDLLDAIAGCVVAAYNVYFDMRFLQYELSLHGIRQSPPHVHYRECEFRRTEHHLEMCGNSHKMSGANDVASSV